MKKLTKLGLMAALLASLSLVTACSSKEKAQEENAEQALVQQTQELMADNEPVLEEESTETPDIEESSSITDESDLGATSSGLGH